MRKVVTEGCGENFGQFLLHVSFTGTWVIDCEYLSVTDEDV